ncbi:MAG: cation transporter [Acidobacteriota bacterium]
MATLTLHLENMHCGSCVRRVTQVLNELPDTHAEEVRVGIARVTTAASPDTVQEALSKAGFPAHVETAGA